MNNHLASRDLLLYVDGELPFWRNCQVRAHLLSCWNCRRELDRLEHDISAIVDAQNRSFLPSTPPPARPWDNFEALAATLPPPRLLLGIWLRQTGNVLGSNFSTSLRWATAVVTLVCVVVTALLLAPERLSAEVVLGRMEKAEFARTSTNVGQVIRQRLHVERIDRGNSTRRTADVVSWKGGSRSVWRGGLPDLEERYRRAGLESSLPLSPVAGEHWLRETGSEPRVLRDGDRVELEARSAGAGNDVESVSVRIQKENWRLEGLRLTFRDSIFDIAIIDLTTVNKRELSPELSAELEPAIGPSIRARASRSGRADPRSKAKQPVIDPSTNALEHELRVQYRLHEIEADLSEPIELKEEQGTIVIKVHGASDERKQQLAEMFSGDRGVRLETEVSPPDISATVPVTIVPSSPVPGRNADKQLIEFFGSSEAQENFTRSVLSADASILAHLYALRSLAQHWPSNVEPSLSAESRSELQAMVNDHVRESSRMEPELKQLLDPLLDRFCVSGGTSPETFPVQADWRESTTAGLEAARTLDSNLRALITTSASGKNLAETCPALNSSLHLLSSSLGYIASKL